ncbi:MAG: hypothetical protein M1825_001229 [Sarcosagium campestre]|nr:MAG: hypothetical protein M1825_001229 [Sarcosagium campestre]
MRASTLYKTSTFSLLVLFFTFAAGLASSDEKSPKSKEEKPCAVRSSSSGSFFDLSPISLSLPSLDGKSHKDQRNESWYAKGYDYPANFTVNVCAPVVEELQDVEGVEESLWQNVSAFYKMDGKTFSIGQQSSEPIFRGRKLVLQYTDGSPCPSSSKNRRRFSSDDSDEDGDDNDGNDEDKDGEGSKDKSPSVERRKSSIFSFLCDKDALTMKAAVAFVGASPDECAYSFEIRSQAACAGVNDAEQTIGPGGLFGTIAVIAVLVYLVGGCVYQRTVMHARGWRQIPNYSMWAGIASFIRPVSNVDDRVPFSMKTLAFSLALLIHALSARASNVYIGISRRYQDTGPASDLSTNRSFWPDNPFIWIDSNPAIKVEMLVRETYASFVVTQLPESWNISRLDGEEFFKNVPGHLGEYDNRWTLLAEAGVTPTPRSLIPLVVTVWETKQRYIVGQDAGALESDSPSSILSNSEFDILEDLLAIILPGFSIESLHNWSTNPVISWWTTGKRLLSIDVPNRSVAILDIIFLNIYPTRRKASVTKYRLDAELGVANRTSTADTNYEVALRRTGLRDE